jgi:hypothetical protein
VYLISTIIKRCLNRFIIQFFNLNFKFLVKRHLSTSTPFHQSFYYPVSFRFIVSISKFMNLFNSENLIPLVLKMFVKVLKSS